MQRFYQVQVVAPSGGGSGGGGGANITFDTDFIAVVGCCLVGHMIQRIMSSYRE